MPRVLTAEELVAIEQRADAATPGPWTHRTDALGDGIFQERVSGWAITRWAGNIERDDRQMPIDAAFIAHARDDVPDLIETLSWLQRRLIEAEQERDAAYCAVCRLSPNGKKDWCYGGMTGCELAFAHRGGDTHSPEKTQKERIRDLVHKAPPCPRDRDEEMARLTKDRDDWKRVAESVVWEVERLMASRKEVG